MLKDVLLSPVAITIASLAALQAVLWLSQICRWRKP